MRSHPISSAAGKEPLREGPARNKPGRQQAPLYATLARHLTEAIAAGKYPVGSLLPTELALSEQHGMSRQTVREALRQLAVAGVVLRQPGVGTRVQRQHTPVRYTHSVNSFTDLEQYAKELRLVIAKAETVVATGELAQFIGCRESSKWLRIRGVRCAAGSDEPVAYSETYLRDGFPGIGRHLAALQGTAMHLLLEREYGEVVEEIRQQVHAIAVDGEVASALKVPPGSPGLEIRRRFYGLGGRLVISGRVVHAGPEFGYASRFIREQAPDA